jgi:predicted nucleic acid-binding protein
MMIADTDVLIDFLRNRQPVADSIAEMLEKGILSTTSITRFELLAGVRTVKEKNIVDLLLETLPCFPLDEQAADSAAEIRRQLDETGQGIGMADSLIAGITVASKGILLTRNRKHFERIPQLSIEVLSDVD